MMTRGNRLVPTLFYSIFKWILSCIFEDQREESYLMNIVEKLIEKHSDYIQLEQKKKQFFFVHIHSFLGVKLRWKCI